MVGIELASTMGDEIRDPARDLAPAIFIAGIVSIAAYLLVTGAVLTLVPVGPARSHPGNHAGSRRRRARRERRVDRRSARHRHGPCDRGRRVGLVRRLVAHPVCRGSGQRAAAASLGRVHPRWHSPHVALTTCAVLAALFTVFSMVGSTVAEAYQVLLRAAVVIQLIPFIYLFLALIKDRRRERRRARRRRGRPGDDGVRAGRGVSAERRRHQRRVVRNQDDCRRGRSDRGRLVPVQARAARRSGDGRPDGMWAGLASVQSRAHAG